MQSARVEPNLITYNALMHACAQVRRGFNSLTQFSTELKLH